VLQVRRSRSHTHRAHNDGCFYGVHSQRADGVFVREHGFQDRSRRVRALISRTDRRPHRRHSNGVYQARSNIIREQQRKVSGMTVTIVIATGHNCAPTDARIQTLGQ